MVSRAVYVAVAVIVIIVVVVGAIVFVFMQPAPTTGSFSGTNIDVYGGEYGFGTSASSIKSPGPPMTLTAGQSVTINFHNVGTTTHNFAIVTAATDGNTNLAFSGAQIASPSSPVAPGATQSVTFTVGSAGTYYYICQVDGHVSLGMWGTVTVQ